MNFHKGFVITQAANLISVRRAGIVKPRRQIHRALLAAYTAAEMFPSRHCRAVPALRGQAGTKGWPPMATAVMPASCAVSLRVNSSSSSRMKIGPRVRARTFRIRYLACSRPRAACGRHRILHPVSFTSGSPDTILGAGETGPNPATVRISGDLRLAIAPPRDIAGEPPRRLAPGLREGGPVFCRKDRLSSVVHSHLFESCKRYGKPARLGRSCP